jgi:phospholipase D1/2
MVRLDSPSPITRSHHQKLVVIDDRIGFCGGVDFAWGRWDTADHDVHAHRQPGDPGELEEGDVAWPPWHDVHCRVEGPIVATLVHNFRTRWRYVAWEELGRAEVSAPLPGGVPVLSTRTWPEGVPGGDDPIRDELAVKNLLLRWISSARDYVLIEQQYLFSKRMAKALARKLRWAVDRAVHPFRMIIVLPPFFGEPAGATPKMHFMQSRAVRILRQADPEGRHLRLFTLRTWDDREACYTPVYIHAKTMLVDDEWVTIGSANMGDRSLLYDTEFNIAVADPVLARDLRLRLWREHARGPLPDLDVASLADRLEALAKHNGEALERFEQDGDVAALGDHPARRRLFPYRTDGPALDLPLPDLWF